MVRVVALLTLLLAAALFLVAAERDAGTGYELENVHVMDPSMRLTDARRYMLTFNDALGVECRDCHDLRSFASDEHPTKLVAREMMRMTKEINEKWFAEEPEEVVTCFTCHQGQRLPPGAGPGAAGLLLPQE